MHAPPRRLDTDAGRIRRLVEGTISADRLSYTFTLRDGLKFHDGTPVTAEDVVVSLKRWWVKDGGGQIIQKFTKELTAVDDKTFRLVLTQPYGLVLDTLDQVAKVASYQSTVTYPNNGLAQALRAVAGAMNKQIGTKVFWVQTGGFDTHSGQGANNGTYVNLMGTVNDSLAAFYVDLSNQGLIGSTLVIVFSEFGRRISENGSAGTDHGAAGLMMAIGGTVRGGIYGTAADLRLDPANPTLENNAGDVRHETDFRSVYATLIDRWLGANSVEILAGDFKSGAPNFL